jgi:hypothetical protein
LAAVILLDGCNFVELAHSSMWASNVLRGLVAPGEASVSLTGQSEAIHSPWYRRHFDQIIFFADFSMIVLHCSLDLALALGCEVPGTQYHPEEFREGANMIAIRYADYTPPLYWRWQLGRLERALARRSPRRDE